MYKYHGVYNPKRNKHQEAIFGKTMDSQVGYPSPFRPQWEITYRRLPNTRRYTYMVYTYK